MKKAVFSILIVFICAQAFCQTWTADQLNTANTAKNISYLSIVEKEAIQYINLARLYPKQFSKLELTDYAGPAKYGDFLKTSTYKTSLAAELDSITPRTPLVFDNMLFDNAKCFAVESGDLGLVGHQRKNCPKGNYAECCSYGMDTGKDIAMQWLIDDKIENLGHRKNCLNRTYTKIGLSVHSHIKYGTCAVAELIW